MCIDGKRVLFRHGAGGIREVARRTFRSIISLFLTSSSVFKGSCSSLASGLDSSDAEASELAGASASAGVVE